MKRPVLAVLAAAFCLSLPVVALPVAAHADPCPGFDQTMDQIEQILDARERTGMGATPAVQFQEISRELTQELKMANRSLRERAAGISAGGKWVNASVQVFPLEDRADTAAWARRELARQGKYAETSRSGYTPRSYASQYAMPRAGNRSRPEEATRYR